MQFHNTFHLFSQLLFWSSGKSSKIKWNKKCRKVNCRLMHWDWDTCTVYSKMDSSLFAGCTVNPTELWRVRPSQICVSPYRSSTPSSKTTGCPLPWTAPAPSTSSCWTAGRRNATTGPSLARLSTTWTRWSVTPTAWRLWLLCHQGGFENMPQSDWKTCFRILNSS